MQQEDALVIIKATYGPFDAEDTRPWMLRFVTDQLRDIVRKQGGDMLLLEAKMNAVFGDPSPDEPKVLRVYYFQNGYRGYRCVPENSRLLIDARRSRILAMRKRSRSSQSIIKTEETELPHTNPDILRTILKFLPLFPDRISCAAVCRAWRDQLYREGLTDHFSVGMRSYRGQPCFLDMPIRVLQRVFAHSKETLVSLDLSFYEKITDSVLGPALLSDLAILEDLNLSGCSQLTDASLSLIGENCRKLRKVHLKRLLNISDISVINIAHYCTDLELINLSDCSQLTDECIISISQNLHRLYVFHSRDLYRLTDASISQLLIQCGSNLEVLSLWSTNQITSQSLSVLRQISCDKLASLSLGDCWALDDVAIIGSVCSCSNLVDLSLRNCHLLTDSAVISIARKLRKLEHLDLTYLVSITDASLSTIATYLKLLRSLNLTHCANVSETGIFELAGILPQLSELFLAYIPLFSDATIVQLMEVIVHSHAASTLNIIDMRGNLEVSSNSLGTISTKLGRQFSENPQRVFFFDPNLVGHE